MHFPHLSQLILRIVIKMACDSKVTHLSLKISLVDIAFHACNRIRTCVIVNVCVLIRSLL